MNPKRPLKNVCIICEMSQRSRLYSVLDLNIRVTELIRNWVYPQKITEDDIVCEDCKDFAFMSVNELLQNSVSSTDDQKAGPSHRGVTELCVTCACSIDRCQSYKVLVNNPNSMNVSITNIIKSRVAPRQITASDRICNDCSLQIQREVYSVNVLGLGRSQSASSEPQEHDQPPEHDQLLENTSPPDSSVANNQELVLPNYRRACNIDYHCVFPTCNSTNLHIISDELRVHVLSNHRYYLPDLITVCPHHLNSNSWDILFNSENSLDTFTAEQIEHVFSLINVVNDNKIQSGINPILNFVTLPEVSYCDEELSSNPSN